LEVPAPRIPDQAGMDKDREGAVGCSRKYFRDSRELVRNKSDAPASGKVGGAHEAVGCDGGAVVAAASLLGKQPLCTKLTH